MKIQHWVILESFFCLKASQFKHFQTGTQGKVSFPPLINVGVTIFFSELLKLLGFYNLNHIVPDSNYIFRIVSAYDVCEIFVDFC